MHEGESFPYGALSGDGGRHDRSVVSFSLPACTGPAPDLSRLTGEVAAGRLDSNVSWRGGRDRAADAVSALLERRPHGKAVLDVS